MNRAQQIHFYFVLFFFSASWVRNLKIRYFLVLLANENSCCQQRNQEMQGKGTLDLASWFQDLFFHWDRVCAWEQAAAEMTWAEDWSNHPGWRQATTSYQSCWVAARVSAKESGSGGPGRKGSALASVAESQVPKDIASLRTSLTHISSTCIFHLAPKFKT